jgi:hypothetical protein
MYVAVGSFVLSAAAVGAGCSGPESDLATLPEVPADNPEAPTGDADSSVTSIGFQVGGELILRAGQTASIRIQVQPPGEYDVRFALLGETRDAFLSRDVTKTDASGLADTSLTVLAASSSFGVRAAAGAASKMLHIVTLEASEGSLIVTPQYEGNRAHPAWTASVHVNQTCAGLQGIPFPDGSIIVTAIGDSVRVGGIPADVPLAAVVRAEQYIGGCRTIPALRASADTFIDIDVMDRPMQISGLQLQIALGVESTPMLNPALDELAFRAVLPLAGSAPDDLAALLDAMASLAANRAAFDQARTARGWRGVLVADLDPTMVDSGLRGMIQGWMRTGLGRLSQPDAIVGTLSTLGPEGMASMELASVIGLSPEAAGFPVQSAASALAETEDFLRIGATLSWLPSPFLAAAANLVVVSEDPARTSAADAMATQFDCENMATLLVNAGATPGQAFAGCNQACMLDLCRGAMVQLWSRVAGSDLPAVPWQISAASRAEIDENARLIHVEGNWIGSLTLSEFGNSLIQGPYSGTNP